MTDIVTYGQLMIMNTISFEVETFKWIDVWTLFGVLFVQLIIITIFAYAGNGIFFKIIPPEKCIIITRKESDLEKISRGVQKYKKQYRISRVVDYRRSDLEDILLRMETAILYDLPREKREYLVNFCYEHLINIYMNPEIPDVVENLAEHYLLDDVSMLNANVQGLTFEQRVVKRTFDIVLSILGIIVTSPILIIVAIAIKLGDGGPVFFYQQRATRGGRIFKVVKFRSMKVNCGNVSVSEGDDRITPVGKVIRKYRLDELPQLWNVIIGDMSLVGPRPETPHYVRIFSERFPDYPKRHAVRPGLTGLAQVSGRNNITWEQKFKYDLIYIDKGITFWKDLWIIFMTVGKVFKREDTVREGTESDVDFGDWLLQKGELTQDAYDAGQKEAKDLLNV